MKIIKSLLLVTISVGTAIAVQAQQEEKTIKALPVELTKAPVVDSKPSVIPVIKMIDGDAVQAAPSPLTRKDNTPVPGNENIILKAVDVNAATNQLTTDQINTLNGVSKLPKQSAGTPATVDNKPLPLAKPVLVKEQ